MNRINVEYCPIGYCAYDPESIDGAPDASGAMTAQGFGETKREAVSDLLEQFEHHGFEDGRKACVEWLEGQR